MRIALAALSMMPLAACMVTPAGQPGAGDPTGACRNEPLDQFTGQPASDCPRPDNDGLVMK